MTHFGLIAHSQPFGRSQAAPHGDKSALLRSANSSSSVFSIPEIFLSHPFFTQLSAFQPQHPEFGYQHPRVTLSTQNLSTQNLSTWNPATVPPALSTSTHSTSCTLATHQHSFLMNHPTFSPVVSSSEPHTAMDDIWQKVVKKLHAHNPLDNRVKQNPNTPTASTKTAVPHQAISPPTSWCNPETMTLEQIDERI